VVEVEGDMGTLIMDYSTAYYVARHAGGCLSVAGRPELVADAE